MPSGTPEQMRWFNDLQRMTTSPGNAARIRRANENIDITDLLPQIRIPTLVLHCRNDAARNHTRRAASLPPVFLEHASSRLKATITLSWKVTPAGPASSTRSEFSSRPNFLFVRAELSAFGPYRTSLAAPHMSAFGGNKADITVRRHHPADALPR